MKKRGPRPGHFNPKSLANLHPRAKGVPGKKWSAAVKIAGKLLDKEWQRLAKLRMKAGKAPHLELFFLQHKFGKPKDVVEHSGPNGGPIPFADMSIEEKRERAVAVLSRLAVLTGAGDGEGPGRN